MKAATIPSFRVIIQYHHHGHQLLILHIITFSRDVKKAHERRNFRSVKSSFISVCLLDLVDNALTKLLRLVASLERQLLVGVELALHGAVGARAREVVAELELTARLANVDGLGVVGDDPVLRLGVPVGEVAAGEARAEDSRATGGDSDAVETTELDWRIVTTEGDVLSSG